MKQKEAQNFIKKSVPCKKNNKDHRPIKARQIWEAR